MVAWYSYIVMVKPGEQCEEVLNLSRYFGRTINFVILFHIDKRVVVCVTVEMHIRPTNFVSANSDSPGMGRDALYTPVPPELLENWMPVEELQSGFSVRHNINRIATYSGVETAHIAV